MATILNMSSFDAALKVQYPDMAVKLMAYKNNPLLALIPKDENGGGKNITFPVHYGHPQGRSATFTTAGTNKYSSNLDDFVVVRVRNYGRADIDGETLEASRGDAKAFMEAARLEIDGVLFSLSRDLAFDLYRTGSGARGRVSSKSAGIITLSDAESVVNFEVGMKLVFSTTEFAAHDSNGLVTITRIDRSAGTIGVSLSGGTSLVAGQYLHVQGDHAEGEAAASRLKLSGLAAWIPSAAPGVNDSFWGINRSVDGTRLAGLRVTGTGQTEEEALIKGAWAIYREGGRPDVCLVNPIHMANLDKVLAGRARYCTADSPDAAISFEAISLHTPAGSIKVVADPNCPTKIAWMLNLSTWRLSTIGAAPKILQQDGLRVLRNSGSDSVEVRCGYYGNLICTQPHQNARISLDG